MKRRRFVRSLCGSVVTGASIATVSGCTAFQHRDTVRIGLAEVVNLDESSEHEVRVQFTESGNVVYDERHRLSGHDGTVPPSVVVDDELPDRRGQYELRVTLDSQSEPQRMDVAPTTEGDCTNVLVLIRSASWVGLTATERCYGDAADESTVRESRSSTGRP